MYNSQIKNSSSIYSQSLQPEVPERKERLFLPSFPLKSHQASKHTKKQEKVQVIKVKPVMSPEQVKVLCEKIDPIKSLNIPPIRKIKLTKGQLKIKNFRFKFRSTPPIGSYNPPFKSLYISKLFQKREKDLFGENYKFMLTGANFTYLHNRILENDSSTNSFVQDLPGLDAKYKASSPEPKGRNFMIRTMNGFSDSEKVNKDQRRRWSKNIGDNDLQPISYLV